MDHHIKETIPGQDCVCLVKLLAEILLARLPPAPINDMGSSGKPWVIVVGAGPSGLLLALMLGQKGIPVHVLEGAAELDDSPRAAYYGPPAAYELRRAGVIDEIRKDGFDPVIMCWRKLDGTYLAGFNNRLMKDDPDRLACMPLRDLDRLLYKRATALPSVKVFFNHKVVDVGQDEEKGWIDVETPEGSKRLEATYIVGCDGATSTVRSKLFPDKDFPGYTWDKQIVATNVRKLDAIINLTMLTMPRYHILSRNLDTRMYNFSSTLSIFTWWPV